MNGRVLSAHPNISMGLKGMFPPARWKCSDPENCGLLRSVAGGKLEIIDGVPSVCRLSWASLGDHSQIMEGAEPVFGSDAIQ